MSHLSDRYEEWLYEKQLTDWEAEMNTEELTPQQIRDEFTSLWEDALVGKEYLLRALASYISTDRLAEFMDDLAHGRV